MMHYGPYGYYPMPYPPYGYPYQHYGVSQSAVAILYVQHVVVYMYTYASTLYVYTAIIGSENGFKCTYTCMKSVSAINPIIHVLHNIFLLSIRVSKLLQLLGTVT